MLVCLWKITYIALPAPGGEGVLRWLAVPCPEASTFMSTSDCPAALMNACVVSMQTMRHTQFICCIEAVFTTTVWSCSESAVAFTPGGDAVLTMPTPECAAMPLQRACASRRILVRGIWVWRGARAGSLLSARCGVVRYEEVVQRWVW